MHRPGFRRARVVLWLIAAYTLAALVAVIAAESIARSRNGYRLDIVTLEKVPAPRPIYQGDIRFDYNRRWIEQLGWDPKQVASIFDPVARFGVDTLYPRYLFRRNFALAVRGDNRLVPVDPTTPDAWWRSNSLGLRGRELAEANSCRVILTGGSVAEGHTVDDQTIAAYLGRTLTRRLAVPVEAINAGITGLSIGDALALARFTLFDLHPDAIVYFDAGNRLDPFGHFVIHRERRPLLTGWLDDHSLLYRSTLEKLEWPRPAIPYDVDETRPDARLDEYVQLGVEFAKETGERRIDFLWLVPMAGYQAHHWGRRVPSDVYWLYSHWYPIRPSDVQRGFYRHAASRFVAASREHGIPFLDLQDTVGSDERNFLRHGEILDLAHFSARGNAAIADAIAESLLPRLRGRPMCRSAG